MRTNVVCGLLVVVAVACGGRVEVQGSGASGSGPEFSPGAVAVATAVCNQALQCSPAALHEDDLDLGHCVQINATLYSQGVGLPGSGLTEEHMTACAAAIAANGCANRFDLAACDFSGDVATGGACADGAQCVKGDFCDVPQGGACGICAAERTEGQDCTRVVCASGLWCVYRGSTGTCEVPRQEGEACNDEVTPCGAHLACTSGVCVPASTVGDSCGPPVSSCDTSLDLYCSSAGTCSTWRVAEPGEGCGTPSDPSVVCAGLYVGVECRYPSDGSGEGTCVLPIAEGEPCGGDIQGTCGDLLTCTKGICAPSAAVTSCE